MSFERLVIIAAGGSLALMLGALAFQHIGGLDPCKMCYWQRWPHWTAIGIGAVALLTGGRLWALLGALAAATTGAIGVYHSGVEQKLWQGPTSCTGDGGLTGMSGGSLLDFSGAELPVMCDDIVWDTWGLGITMASWNAVISFALVAVWIMAWRRA